MSDHISLFTNRNLVHVSDKNEFTALITVTFRIKLGLKLKATVSVTPCRELLDGGFLMSHSVCELFTDLQKL